MELFFRKRERHAPVSIDLDTLYYSRNSNIFLKALRTFPILFNLTLRQLEKQVIDDLKSGNTTIHKELYKAYSESLLKGVSGVMDSNNYGDKYFDLQQQLQASVARFAAYKAYHATQQIQRQQADKSGVERSDEAYRQSAKKVFDTFNRYQVAEYNTTVARARTAQQWIDFNNDPISNELYPNLKWLQTRSATPRKDHWEFRGLVLPKNHPFWQSNQPGNLWQCKCDWEETDEPAAGEAPQTKIAARGLEGNPGETGEVFTDNASYFNVQSSGRDKVRQFFEPIENNHKEYIRYAKDTNYQDVKFSWGNGGIMATHKGHNRSHIRDERFFAENLTSTDLEKECQKILFKNGYSCILENESIKGIDGNLLTTLDTTTNGKPMDIKSATQNVRNYRNMLNDKNKQLNRYNQREGVTQANTVILYFHDPLFYEPQKVADGIVGLNKMLAAENKTNHIKEIICVVSDGRVERFK